MDKTIGPERSSLAASASGESAGVEGKPEAVEADAIVEDGDTLSANDITAPAAAPGLPDQKPAMEKAKTRLVTQLWGQGQGSSG